MAAAAAIGGWLAGRRAARISRAWALAESRDAPDGRVLPPARLIGGLLALTCGLGLGLTTGLRPDDMYLAATGGPACVVTAIGLALLSPVFIRLLAAAATVVPHSLVKLDSPVPKVRCGPTWRSSSAPC